MMCFFLRLMCFFFSRVCARTRAKSRARPAPHVQKSHYTRELCRPNTPLAVGRARVAHGRCMRTDTAVSTRPKRSARVCGARPRGRGAATIAPTWRVSYASEGHAPVLSAAREHRQIGQAWRVCAAPLARPPRPPRTRCGRTGRPRPRRRTRQASTATTRDCAASREGARGRASRLLRRALAFPAATTRCRSEWPTFTCHKVSCPRGHCGRPPVLRSSSDVRATVAPHAAE